MTCFCIAQHFPPLFPLKMLLKSIEQILPFFHIFLGRHALFLHDAIDQRYETLGQ